MKDKYTELRKKCNKDSLAVQKRKHNKLIKQRDDFFSPHKKVNEENDNFILIHSAENKRELRDYKGAIKDCTKIINTHSKNDSILSNKDKKLIFGDSKAHSLYSYAYSLRGEVKYYLKDYQSAIEDFNKSIEIDSSHDMVYYWRAVTKNKLKDYKNAIKDFNKAIKMNTEDTHFYLERGITKYHLKDYKEAIKDCNKAIEINPENSEVYLIKNRAKKEK